MVIYCLKRVLSEKHLLQSITVSCQKIIMNLSGKIQTENPDLVDIDDQFLLRLPKAEAKQIHKILKSKPKKLKKYLQLELFEDFRKARVFIKKKPLEATLVNLPTIIESNKTINKVNIYKTGNISQMLICKDWCLNNNLDEEKKYLYPHGLTPPMKNVRKQRFRKTMRNHEEVKEAADIQKEVALLLRADHEAVATRFEIIRLLQNNNNGEGVTEQMLFGALSSSDSEVDSRYDIIEFNN